MSHRAPASPTGEGSSAGLILKFQPDWRLNFIGYFYGQFPLVYRSDLEIKWQGRVCVG